MSKLSSPHMHPSKRSGFTLVELLVVIAIIGVFMAGILVTLFLIFSRSNKLIRNGLVILGVSAYWEGFFVGLLILSVVFVDHRLRRAAT